MSEADEGMVHTDITDDPLGDEPDEDVVEDELDWFDEEEDE